MTAPVTLNDEVEILKQRIEILEANIKNLIEVNNLINKNFKIVIELLKSDVSKKEVELNVIR